MPFLRKGGFIAIVGLLAFSAFAQQPGSGAGADVDTPAVSSSSGTPSAAAGGVPRWIKFSGVVDTQSIRATRSGAGKPAEPVVVGITFSLYELQEGGAPLWTESQKVQLDDQGRYSVLLGANSPNGLPLDLFTSGRALWLGIQPSLPGAVEAPRVLLVAVPYALKAADADTLRGLPPEAFLPSSSAASSPPASQSQAGTQPGAGPSLINGKPDFIPIWLDANRLGNSILFQNATGVGVGTQSPQAKLDVKGGASVRGPLLLPAVGTATPSSGSPSHSTDFQAASFSSATQSSLSQLFRWQAEPAGNNTASPSGTLNLLFASGNNPASETGLSISSQGIVTFVPGQTFGPGAGSVTSVAMTGDGTLFNTKVAGSPITTSGTLAPTLLSQPNNTFLAGPTAAGSAPPTFRPIGATDLGLNSPGSLLYFNGASLAQLSGNTSGTQCLQEGSTGTPAWGNCGGVGAGIVNSGTAGQVAYYATTGAAVSGSPDVSINGGSLTVGSFNLVVNGLGSTPSMTIGNGYGGSHAYPVPFFRPNAAGPLALDLIPNGTSSSQNVWEDICNQDIYGSSGNFTNLQCLHLGMQAYGTSSYATVTAEGATPQGAVTPPLVLNARNGWGQIGTGASVVSIENISPNGNAALDVGGITDVEQNPVTVEVVNEGTTGTIANELAKLTGSPSKAITATTSDAKQQVIGIVAAGAGTTGKALITRLGVVGCAFDGATTAGDYVTVSTTVSGNCHDYGASLPQDGSSVVGRVMSTNSSGGTYLTLVHLPWVGGATSLSGVTGSVGGAALSLGQCATGTVSITGSSAAVTAGAIIAVTPAAGSFGGASYPGPGFDWGRAYISGSDTVTVQVCADVAGTPTAGSYNVKVIQ